MQGGRFTPLNYEKNNNKNDNFSGFFSRYSLFFLHIPASSLSPLFYIQIPQIIKNLEQQFCRKGWVEKRSRYSCKKVWKIHHKTLLLWVTPTLRVLQSKSLVLTRLKVHCSYHCNCVSLVHILWSEWQVCSVLSLDSVFPSSLNFVTWSNFNFSGFSKVNYSTPVYKLLFISSTDLLFNFIMPWECKKSSR